MTPRTHRVPQGVMDAEARILDEQREAERRVIREAGCDHMDITVRHSAGSTFDDHETVWGVCRRCGQFVVSTLVFGGGGHLETRVMTDRERYRFQTSEERMAEEFSKPPRVLRDGSTWARNE
jgi:hypothetical protein